MEEDKITLFDAVVTLGVLGVFGFIIWAKLREKNSPIYQAVINRKSKDKFQNAGDIKQQIWSEQRTRI